MTRADTAPKAKSKTKIKTTRDQKIFNCIAYPLLTLITLSCLIPFWLIVITSFTDNSYIAVNGYQLFPSELSVAAYEYLFKAPKQIFRAYCVTGVRLFLMRSAACLRVIRFRQTGQYLTLLEVDAKNAPHSVHFFLSPVW